MIEITSRQDNGVLSTHEIAAAEGISPQAVSSCLRKALRKVGGRRVFRLGCDDHLSTRFAGTSTEYMPSTGHGEG
jgi:hypothetical protein